MSNNVQVNKYLFNSIARNWQWEMGNLQQNQIKLSCLPKNLYIFTRLKSGHSKPHGISKVCKSSDCNPRQWLLLLNFLPNHFFFFRNVLLLYIFKEWPGNIEKSANLNKIKLLAITLCTCILDICLGI